MEEDTPPGGKVLDRLLYADPSTGERFIHLNEIPFFKKQKRHLLANNLQVEPTSIDDYLAINGYSALSKVLQEKTPDEVIEEIKQKKSMGLKSMTSPLDLTVKESSYFAVAVDKI